MVPDPAERVTLLDSANDRIGHLGTGPGDYKERRLLARIWSKQLFCVRNSPRYEQPNDLYRGEACRQHRTRRAKVCPRCQQVVNDRNRPRFRGRQRLVDSVNGLDLRRLGA